jgi:anti-sigma factor (TIGR02949 family)
MKSTCEEISDRLSAFVDGEIGAAAIEDIAAHLEQCPGCSDKEKTQRAVKSALNNPALRTATPHDARARIMRAIERQRERLSFGSLVQRLFEFQPVPAFASIIGVVALTGILSLWGGHKMFSTTTAEEPLALLMNTEMEGEVVCIDCELLNISKTPYVHDYKHRLGLRCNKGHFWSILQTAKGSELSSVGHLMHRRIIVKGHIFPTQHLVEVTDYTVI